MAPLGMRKKCPICGQIKVFKNGAKQKTCSQQCAGWYRARNRPKEVQLAVSRKAGQIGAAKKRQRLVADLTRRTAGMSPVDAWRDGYNAGYNAGWSKGVHGHVTNSYEEAAKAARRVA